MIQIAFIPRSCGGVNQAVLADKGKALQIEKLLDSRLIGLEVRSVAQILPRHQIQRGVDDVDLLLHVRRNDLLPAARQLIQV